MTYLLDTNVISEPVSRDPNAAVVEWLAARASASLHLSMLTIAEIDFGLARLPDAGRKARLAAWRGELIRSFGDRLLTVDEAVARLWGRGRARLAEQKKTVSPIDALIAATAEAHGLIVVTRNTRHFAPWGLPVLDPWASDGAVPR